MNNIYQVQIAAVKSVLIEADSPEEAESIVKQQTNLGDLNIDYCSVVDVIDPQDVDKLVKRTKFYGEIITKN